jgi:hypothetical protein
MLVRGPFEQLLSIRETVSSRPEITIFVSVCFIVSVCLVKKPRVCELENSAVVVVDDHTKPKCPVRVILDGGESKRSKGTSVARAISIVEK